MIAEVIWRKPDLQGNQRKKVTEKMRSLASYLLNGGIYMTRGVTISLGKLKESVPIAFRGISSSFSSSSLISSRILPTRCSNTCNSISSSNEYIKANPANKQTVYEMVKGSFIDRQMAMTTSCSVSSPRRSCNTGTAYRIDCIYPQAYR